MLTVALHLSRALSLEILSWPKLVATTTLCDTMTPICDCLWSWNRLNTAEFEPKKNWKHVRKVKNVRRLKMWNSLNNVLIPFVDRSAVTSCDYKVDGLLSRFQLEFREISPSPLSFMRIRMDTSWSWSGSVGILLDFKLTRKFLLGFEERNIWRMQHQPRKKI